MSAKIVQIIDWSRVKKAADKPVQRDFLEIGRVTSQDLADARDAVVASRQAFFRKVIAEAYVKEMALDGWHRFSSVERHRRILYAVRQELGLTVLLGDVAFDKIFEYIDCR